jgi:hypothetical protein
MSSHGGPRLNELRTRRRLARRRRRLARIDLGLGVFVAIVFFLVSPGLAITGLVALVTLLVCVLSLALERGRRARAGGRRSRTADGARPGAGSIRGQRARERRESQRARRVG